MNIKQVSEQIGGYLYLIEARAMRIERAYIKELSYKIINLLTNAAKKFSDKNGFYNHIRAMYGIRGARKDNFINIKHPKTGDLVRVYFTIKSEYEPKDKMTTGWKLLRKGVIVPVINVTLDRKKDVSFYIGDFFRKELEGNLVHEFVHVYDRLLIPSSMYYRLKYKEGDPDYLYKYYNDKWEVTAFGRMIIDEVMDDIDKFVKSGLKSEYPYDELDWRLYRDSLLSADGFGLKKVSSIWNEIYKYLNDKNKKRILKMVYTEVDEFIQKKIKELSPELRYEAVN